MLSDEQMSKRLPFSLLLNDEQMSNWVGVKHLPDKNDSRIRYHIEHDIISIISRLLFDYI